MMDAVDSFAVADGARLFPGAAYRRAWDDRLTALLAEAAIRVRQGPVRPAIDLAGCREELAGWDFENPVPPEELLAWTIGQLENGMVHTGHQRYFGLFNPAPSFPALCADRIAAAFNPQLASATTSPVPVEIEAHVARAVARRAGLGPAAVGHFCTGGSEANFTALVCALTRAEPEFAKTGSRAFGGQPVFYVSRDCHLAWIKIAHQAGIGRDAVRLVKTDGSGRMAMDALRGMIAADRAAGFVPVMVAATAGTTNAGMIDDLPASAATARGEKTWFHVDAAWGGGLIASDKLRGRLAGIEMADSVTIDAHKWFATTMGCGMFITAHAEALTNAFSVAASFMPSHAPECDPYTSTVQWSRRFLGLRLFLSLAAVGWAGHAAHVERAVDLVRVLAGKLQARGWTIANDMSLAVLCAEPPAGAAPVREIVTRVVGSGAAWVSVASYEGREVVRACVTHGETSEADVVALAGALEAARMKAV
jgi:glutamate/tyrosine decarboxylase-like PLP-dependent enzyme